VRSPLVGHVEQFSETHLNKPYLKALRRLSRARRLSNTICHSSNSAAMNEAVFVANSWYLSKVAACPSIARLSFDK
jgi:hypothetical protein